MKKKIIEVCNANLGVLSDTDSCATFIRYNIKSFREIQFISIFHIENINIKLTQIF